MSQTVLIAFATRAGSTPEIAHAVGETLAARGFNVDVQPVRQVRSLQAYDAVILGSPIRVGNWLPEATAFVRTFQADLNRLPVALFTAHMLNLGEDEASRTARLTYTAPVRALLPNAQETFFAGKVDYRTLSFFDRLLTKMIEKQTGQPVGDMRNWDAIRQWAQGVFA